MLKTLVNVLKVFVVGSALLSSSACAIYHHYGPYHGKVIDEETGQPLEGAVVLAKYRTELYLSPGGVTQYFLDAQETVTDKNGEFRIPSLNAFAFRPMSLFDSDPGFTIFKPHYECYTGSTKFMPNYTLPVDQYVTIELKELKTREARRANLRSCYSLSVPDRKQKKYIELENVEDVELGLSPRPLPKE